MKIILMKDHKKKILNKRISPLDQSVGIVSLEKIENGTEFTIRVLDVNHIRYHYDPETRKFEVHFLSLKKELKKKKVNENENHEHSF